MRLLICYVVFVWSFSIQLNRLQNMMKEYFQPEEPPPTEPEEPAATKSQDEVRPYKIYY